MTTQFKIVLLGDGQVGKSAYVNRIKTGEFEKKYVATLGVMVHPILLKTSMGAIVLNMWDCAGVEEFGGMRNGYYAKADAGIVMYDVNDPNPKDRVNYWIKELRGVVGDDIPIVVCGNKFDQCKSLQIVNYWGNDPKIMFTPLSVRTCYEWEEPLKYLAKTLLQSKLDNFQLTW